MAPTDKIEVKAKFSLPYKPGMEKEPGFAGTRENVILKAFSADPQKVATFLFVTSKTLAEWLAYLKLTMETAAIEGVQVKAQNASRNAPSNALQTKYSIGVGGLGKRLVNDAQKVFTLAVTKGGATPEKAYKQVVVFFGMKGEIITPEQLIEAGVK